MGGVIGGMIGGRTATAPPPPMLVREQPRQAEPETAGKMDASLGVLAQSGSQAWVDVKIWLTDESAAVVDKLKKLGFEIKARMPGKLLPTKSNSKISARASVSAGKKVRHKMMRMTLHFKKSIPPLCTIT